MARKKRDPDSVEKIKKQVEARCAAESERLSNSDGSIEQKDFKITSHLISDRLFENEYGDGVLYADYHKDKFVFDKSAGCWLAYNGHHLGSAWGRTTVTH